MQGWVGGRKEGRGLKGKEPSGGAIVSVDLSYFFYYLHPVGGKKSHY